MYVTAWSNGQPTSSGAGYGVRISETDRDQYFDRRWSEALVDLGDDVRAVVPLSASFWERCSELRSAAIGRWLLGHQLAPWPPGHPPRFILRHVAENRFELKQQAQRPARGQR
jgi:hypothetical protein